MKTNTLRQRLKLYKKMLIDYKDGTGWYLSGGFCLYLDKNCGVFSYTFGSIEKILPEIGMYKPKRDYDYFGHWFRQGDLKPRIAVLKKAIAYTEKKIAQGKK